VCLNTTSPVLVEFSTADCTGPPTYTGAIDGGMDGTCIDMGRPGDSLPQGMRGQCVFDALPRPPSSAGLVTILYTDQECATAQLQETTYVTDRCFATDDGASSSAVRCNATAALFSVYAGGTCGGTPVQQDVMPYPASGVCDRGILVTCAGAADLNAPLTAVGSGAPPPRVITAPQAWAAAGSGPTAAMAKALLASRAAA